MRRRRPAYPTAFGLPKRGPAGGTKMCRYSGLQLLPCGKADHAETESADLKNPLA